MARQIANHASGKYLRMNDEQTAREQAKFERAVERQRAEDERRAAARRNDPRLIAHDQENLYGSSPIHAFQPTPTGCAGCEG